MENRKNIVNSAIISRIKGRNITLLVLPHHFVRKRELTSGDR